MIDSKELRLGNWVADAYGGYCQVIAISADELRTNPNDSTMPVDCYNPIALSPEVLGRLAKRDYEIEEIETYGLSECWILSVSDSLGKTKDGAYVYIPWDYFDQKIDVTYLHELQNAIYAVSKEELQITLTDK